MKKRPAFGPFFILAMLLSLPLVYLHYGRHPAPRPPRSAPPFLVPFDPVGFVLARGDELTLSERQRLELGKLRGGWERETAELREALTRSAGELERRFSQEKRLADGELRPGSARYGELSRALSAARARYWKKITGLLTAEQVKMLTRPPEQADHAPGAAGSPGAEKRDRR